MCSPYMTIAHVRVCAIIKCSRSFLLYIISVFFAFGCAPQRILFLLTFIFDNTLNCKANAPSRIHYFMVKNSKKNTRNAIIDLHVCKIYVKFKDENSRPGSDATAVLIPTKYA